MGCLNTKDSSTNAAAQRSQTLDLANQKSHDTEQLVHKVLLLGTGESGKSALMKQMKLLFGQGFDDQDRDIFRKHIWVNVLESAHALVEAVQRYQFTIDSSVRPSYDFIASCPIERDLNEEIAHHIMCLWRDVSVQKAWVRRSEYQIIESSGRFFEQIQRISSQHYVPTAEDMLLSRVRSTGIVEEAYNVNSNQFKVYDVGGQRNERKKWMHCFDNVTAVVFVVALSEYDQTLFEDEDTNRMAESISLFTEIANAEWFRNSILFLFFNKIDLFADKIKTVNIAQIPAFSDYCGTPNNYEEGLAYFLNRFRTACKNPNRLSRHFLTCATDSNSVREVLGVVCNTVASSASSTTASSDF